MYSVYYTCNVGEFGIVYKGYVVKDQGSIMTDIVAIKTLKGIPYFNTYVISSSTSSF